MKIFAKFYEFEVGGLGLWYQMGLGLVTGACIAAALVIILPRTACSYHSHITHPFIPNPSIGS